MIKLVDNVTYICKNPISINGQQVREAYVIDGNSNKQLRTAIKWTGLIFPNIYEVNTSEVTSFELFSYK